MIAAKECFRNMATLDDTTLIHKFVKGEGELLSNQNLRVESAFDTTQLLAKKGGVVAVIKQNCQIPSISVNLSSPYLRLTHTALLKNSLVPVEQPEKQLFMKYEYHEMPAGYQIHYTSAKILWSQWYTQQRLHNRRTIQIDLLVLTRSQWYPIRDITYNPGEFFVETLVEEMRLQNTDRVVWLSRVPANQDKALPKQSQSSAFHQEKLRQALQIDPEQRQLALTIRPIAFCVLNKCVSQGKAKKIKPGFWLVEGVNYNLVYQPSTDSFSIANVSRGILAKYIGEIVESAANLQTEDVLYWQKINTQLEKIPSNQDN